MKIYDEENIIIFPSLNEINFVELTLSCIYFCVFQGNKMKATAGLRFSFLNLWKWKNKKLVFKQDIRQSHKTKSRSEALPTEIWEFQKLWEKGQFL